jgi:serine protease Do
MGLKQAEGALVADPQKDGPAAKAGVTSGDIITAVNGQLIKDARELARVIGGLAPGSAVKLDMLRNGKGKVVNLTLGQLPNAQEAKADTDADSKGSTMDVPRLGMTVAPADKVEGAGKQGVVVTKVDPKGAAADRGFKKGDVILEVAGKSVATPNDVRDAIEAARTDKKNSVLMRLRSGDASRYVAVPLASG